MREEKAAELEAERERFVKEYEDTPFFEDEFEERLDELCEFAVEVIKSQVAATEFLGVIEQAEDTDFAIADEEAELVHSLVTSLEMQVTLDEALG